MGLISAGAALDIASKVQRKRLEEAHQVSQACLNEELEMIANMIASSAKKGQTSISYANKKLHRSITAEAWSALIDKLKDALRKARYRVEFNSEGLDIYWANGSAEP